MTVLERTRAISYITKCINNLLRAWNNYNAFIFGVFFQSVPKPSVVNTDDGVSSDDDNVNVYLKEENKHSAVLELPSGRGGSPIHTGTLF